MAMDWIRIGRLPTSIPTSNSVADNPLVDTRELAGRILSNANFQARSITSAMDKARQEMHTLAQMLFAPCTEVVKTNLSNDLANLHDILKTSQTGFTRHQGTETNVFYLDCSRPIVLLFAK